MMKKMVCIILGGGKGTRLFPLTEFRSKPAVPLGGKFRLIDIPISNCINSGINQIYLLTQFNSVSLHRHIRQTYTFDRFGGGFVEILAAQQTNEGELWYQGTADAVRKQLRYLEQPGIEHVLVVSGDQIYRMNYEQMLRTHVDSRADATIAALPVHREAASAFGIMRIDGTGRVQGFLEKPTTDDELKIVRTDPSWFDSQGIPSKGRECLASMGIYLFNRDVLVEILSKNNYQDFGKEVFPLSIRARRVQCHLFDGYWEDVGTIRSFYDANLAIASASPPLNFADEEAPIYSRARQLPSTRIEGATVSNSLISDGCVIGKGAVIENSVIGLRCHIGQNVTIRNSIIMGADLYDSEAQVATNARAGRPNLGIGSDSVLEGVIADKNCAIGHKVRIQARPGMEANCDLNGAYVRDGIIIVPKDGVLPDGWSLT